MGSPRGPDPPRKHIILYRIRVPILSILESGMSNFSFSGPYYLYCTRTSTKTGTVRYRTAYPAAANGAHRPLLLYSTSTCELHPAGVSLAPGHHNGSLRRRPGRRTGPRHSCLLHYSSTVQLLPDLRLLAAILNLLRLYTLKCRQFWL